MGGEVKHVQWGSIRGRIFIGVGRGVEGDYGMGMLGFGTFSSSNRESHDGGISHTMGSQSEDRLRTCDV